MAVGEFRPPPGLDRVKSLDWTDKNCTYLHGFGQLRHSNMPSRYSLVTSFKQLFTSRKLKDTKKMIDKSVKILC